MPPVTSTPGWPDAEVTVDPRSRSDPFCNRTATPPVPAGSVNPDAATPPFATSSAGSLVATSVTAPDCVASFSMFE
jgi:hypothetical protein